MLLGRIIPMALWTFSMGFSLKNVPGDQPNQWTWLVKSGRILMDGSHSLVAL